MEKEATQTTMTKRARRGETEADVKRLWTAGLSDKEIAAELGMSYQTVYHHRKKFGAANVKTGPELRSAPSQAVTLAEIDEQKRLLEEDYHAKLRGFEQQKQRLVEANKVTVSPCQEGRALFIKFGLHEHMTVPKEKPKN